jgi:hypothetical protein
VWQIGVTADPVAPAPGEPVRQVATLAEAITEWNKQDAGTVGIISVMDSRTYAESLKDEHEIEIPSGSRLLIIAAEWPRLASGSYVLDPDPRQLTVSGLRPLISASGGSEIRVHGSADDANPGSLTINGLVVNGQLVVSDGNLGGLHLVHSTLVPGMGGLVAEAESNERLVVTIERSIAGRVKVATTVSALEVVDSIVDHANDIAISAGDASVQTSTVLGLTAVRTLRAGNSIFTGKVSVERRQTGCVRFCYLPRNSAVPQRYRCQPATAALAKHVVPQFTAALYGAPGVAPYGQPAYAQLALSCPPEILTGAEDEGEMGVFHFLQQSKRLANLRASLDEYLRFGLEAGIFLVT